MVCIAAFIILALVGVFVALASVFKPKLWKAYVKALKKAWGCLWKKVRLQKCETGFKDDVKNSLLSRVIIKHPKWLRPLSIIIEALFGGTGRDTSVYPTYGNGGKNIGNTVRCIIGS